MKDDANAIYADYMRLLQHTVRFYATILENSSLEQMPHLVMQLLDDMQNIMRAILPFDVIAKLKSNDK